MKIHTLVSLVFVILGSLPQAQAASISNNQLVITVALTGNYQITAKALNWQLSGSLPSPAQGVAVGKDKDALGDFQALSFTYTDAGRPMSGLIRLYEGKGLVLFSQTSPQASVGPPSAFPNFTTLPPNHFLFSYADDAFAPPRFDLEKTSTPCLLFDRQDHAMVISPASHFVVACMVGDGRQQLGSGFNSNLKNIPAGFTQETLLALGQGINHTWDTWGRALTDLEGKKRPANDEDTILKYDGYWTDNGGAYWYNYDLEKGYQGTLQAVVDSYRAEQIPLRYMQLDSWWYHKTITKPNGKLGGPKNPNLPEGDWNRYGGTIEYKAHPFIFPDGMEAFHEKAGLPFITHNRWIDPASPYHERYKISGIAAIDPGFWNEIASYLKDNGVIAYEQDWISDILKYSPGLSSTVDEGDSFFDGMADACKEHGLSVQYCMATPPAFLEGSKYDNLTTIRVSGDRFKSSKYRHFLYTSRLADSLGIWPWTDVYNSTEITNLLLGTLSAGPVGTGDALGQEDKANLFKAIRADGVIVKPDAPLVPIDSAYVTEAEGKDFPLEASTYTDHGDVKTLYAVAIRLPKSQVSTFTFNPTDLGLAGPAYFYDYFAGTAQRSDPGQTVSSQVNADGVSYFIVAPVGQSGIAFLGDPGKFVSTGQQRIASIRDQPGELDTEVLLAPDERQVTLHGYADKPPQVFAQPGKVGPVQYDAATHHFTVTVLADTTAPTEGHPDPVRRMTVAFRAF